MKLSFSAISTYQNCPLAYKFTYIERLPTKRTPLLSFGSSIHSALAKFYDVSIPKPPPLENLFKHLSKFWEKDGYSDQSEEKLYFDHAKQILTNFYHTNISHFQIPAAVEQKFQFEIDGRSLSGIIDRMDKLPSGGYEIIDYKTGKNLPPKSRVDTDLQLSIYYMASHEVWGIEPEKLTLYFLIPNHKISTVRTKEDIITTKKIIHQVAENIEEKKFEPRENALCPWCDFQNRCPIFKHKFLPEETRGKVSASEIKNVVDEYAELKRKERENQQRLEGLREIIHTYCEEHDLSRLYTNKTILTRDSRAFSTYDTEKLREILEPLGLWKKIIKVDQVALRQVLEREDLEREVKQALEAAKEAENITYALYVRENLDTDLRR